MSRRKQAKPRLWKRDEEKEEDEGSVEQSTFNAAYENNPSGGKIEPKELDEVSFSLLALPPSKDNILSDDSAEENISKEIDSVEENRCGKYSHGYDTTTSRNATKSKECDQFDDFLPDDDNSLDSDTLGTEEGSSWASEERTPSPGSSCPTPTSTTELLDSELSFTVGATEGSPHQCRFCDKAFPKLSYLKKHEQSHADCMPFRCEYCRRMFKHKRSRDRHIKLHTGDKKYKCNLCEAAFSRSDHLKIHMKTHDNQKPFQCTVCNRGYNTAAALTSHMQNHKKRENSPSLQSNSFKCLKCGQMFVKPEDLQSHASTHSSCVESTQNGKVKTSYLGPCTCLLCFEEFSSTDTMDCHLRSVHKIVDESCRSVDESDEKCSTVSASTANFSSTTSVRRPNRSFSTTPTSSYFCETQYAHPKHGGAEAQDILAADRTLAFAPYSAAEMANSVETLACGLCTLSFPNAVTFSEHFVAMHGKESTTSAPAPEQMAPTDLTTVRPAARKRAGEERASVLAKKSKDTSPENVGNGGEEGPKTHICSQCGLECIGFESFRAHIKWHLDASNSSLGSRLLGSCGPSERKRSRSCEFRCSHCADTFATEDEASRHAPAHFMSTSVAYVCEDCRKRFDKVDDLHKHLMDAHSNQLYSCSICHGVFDSKFNIQLHFACKHKSETKAIRCLGCPGSTVLYYSEAEFTKHVNNEHLGTVSASSYAKTQNMEKLRCAICHSNFANELDLQLHLATHAKQYQCSLCPQTFHIEYLRDKHMQNCHNTLHMNGNAHENGGKESISSHSPNSLAGRDGKIFENGDAKTSKFIFCDMCERYDFADELDLSSHKKIMHRKTSLLSPEKISNDSTDDERTKGLLKNKINPSVCSLLPSLTSAVRYDGAKKLENFNGCDANGNGVTTCEICEKRDFVNEAELQSHKKLIHHVKLSSPSKVSLHCAYCNENCKSRTDLENHMKNHSQNSTTSGKHKCNICDEMCPTATALAEHKLTHCKVLSGKTCMHCKGSITSEEQFYAHIQQHSTANCTNNVSASTTQIVLPTVCVICRQTLVSEMEARMHARFHLQQSTELVPCSVCYQMSERQELIGGVCRECFQRRDKTSPIRRIECQKQCDNVVTAELRLATAHRKNYTCIVCKANCSSEHDVRLHAATHLLIDGLKAVRNQECRLCRLVLSTPLELQIHLIEHAFPNCGTYTCYICNSALTSAQGLQAHMLEHGLSSRPYDCPRCNQKFFFATELEHHSYLHLEQMTLSEGQTHFFGTEVSKATAPYMAHQTSIPVSETVYNHKISAIFSCSECNVDFRRASDLYEHMNRLHDREQIVDGNDDKSGKENAIRTVNEKRKEIVEIKIEPIKQNECESEEEQIDVVSTKLDEFTGAREIKS